MATEKELKIVILGDGGVGKTSLTYQFVYHYFIQKYDPCIEESYKTTVTVDGETFRIEVFDAQEELAALRDLYMKRSDGFLIVYDITNHQTFDEIEPFREQLMRVRDEDLLTIPVVICGNKSDLSSNRSVSTEEGAKYAKSMGFPFIETSAKTAENVDEAFFSVIRGFMSFKQNQNSDNSKATSGKGKNKCVVC